MISKPHRRSTKELLAALTQEVARLQAENAKLRQDNQQFVEGLTAEVKRLQAENGDLQQTIQTLQVENARLQEQIEQLQKRLEEGSSSQPPAFVKANTPAKERRPRRKRAAEHNHGRRRMSPTRYEQHTIETCPACGDKLGAGTCHYTREVIDIPSPPPVEVVEHQVMRGWCRRCRRWRSAPVRWDGIVAGQGRIGVRLMGLVAYLRARLRLPVESIQEYVATVHGVSLSVGEIGELCRRTTRHVSEDCQALLAQAQASPVLHMDETGWREDGHNGYIWCMVTQIPQPVRYYEYHRSRSGNVARQMLGGFSGLLESDFYAAYNKYSGPHQRCWTHLLRDLHTLRQEHQDNGEIVAWVLAVKWLYVHAKEQLAQGLTASQRQQLYTRLWRMAEQLGLQYATHYKHPCCTLAKRLLRHLDELFQFVVRQHVSADNNLAERALRPLVVQRKISGGSRSQLGSHTRMQLASLFETWRARDLNPLHECWRQLGCELHALSP